MHGTPSTMSGSLKAVFKSRTDITAATLHFFVPFKQRKISEELFAWSLQF
jgi:hypothetical protein